MSEKTLYSFPIRLYSKEDHDLIMGLKQEFSQLTLPRALVLCARTYYEYKKRLELLEKAIKVSYYLDAKVAGEIHPRIKRSTY